jgi:hypothetical protein
MVISTISTWVKRTYSSAHKNMAEATKKGNKMLVEFIDQINATNVLLKENKLKSKTNLLRNNLSISKLKMMLPTTCRLPWAWT